MGPMVARQIETPQGLARAHLIEPSQPGSGAIVLGHGAGGSVGAPDLQRVSKAAAAQGWTAVLVEQPYRVAGRKSPPRAPALDEAWVAILADLRAHELARAATVVTGGRSSGARVACRTAAAVGAQGVLCLAFPLIAPNGSRQDELDGSGVPVLVVQGRNDRFGVPRGSTKLHRKVVRVQGDHGLKQDGPRIAEAVVSWMSALG
jgi:uncharacterized protein